jgi:hypothetical protein
MALPNTDALLQRLIDKINNSRFFTISLGIHVLLVLVFGGTVMYQAIQEPPDFEGGGEGGFVESGPSAPPPPPSQPMQQETNFTVQTPQASTPAVSAITTMSAQALDFTMQQMIVPPTTAPTTVSASAVAPAAPSVSGAGMTAADAAAIGAFTKGWGAGKGSGSGTGIRQREFQFVAFLGRYDGGNWNSTVQVRGNQIVRGSLPNLLYFISKASSNKIKTNERDVKILKLDSDELFTAKPPFIFLTGTRDFKLTDKEVENLRKYVRSGGAIWGDSSVPGLRSRFDIAFRREMKRIIPDKDKDFEPLPRNHPIFTAGYFPEVKEVPEGLNYYKDPIWALKVFGEVAIIYTSNDYGDMWQVGIFPDGKVDLGKDKSGNPVATNMNIWENRDVYMNNVNEQSLLQTYKFGVNVIVHLLTRWEDKVKSPPRL